MAQVIAPHELHGAQAKLLHERVSHGLTVQVFEWQQLRWLQFGTPAVQSVMHTRYPQTLMLSYLPLMVAYRLFLTSPKKTILLGLGGGSLARFLHKHEPETHLVCVEKYADLLEVGSGFFQLPAVGHGMRYVISDAVDFIRGSDEAENDLLLVDLYGRDRMPFFLYQQVFYEHCRTCLSQRGMMVINLLVRDQDELAYLLVIIRRAFQGHCLVLEAKNHSNIIVLAFATAPSEIQVDALREKARNFPVEDNVDFPELVENILHINPAEDGCLLL